MLETFDNTPNLDTEQFTGKYESTGKISTYLVDNYFKAVARLLTNIPEGQLRNALEVGCGAGYSTNSLKNFIPSHTLLSASEFELDLVKLACKRNPEVEIIQEDVYNLQRRAESFDLLFLLEVLEHLEEPVRALQELKRVSSSYLILGVPREPLWRFLNCLRFKYLKDLGNTPGHLNHWSRKGIVSLIEENFGEIIAVENPIPWTIVLAKKRQ